MPESTKRPVPEQYAVLKKLLSDAPECTRPQWRIWGDLRPWRQDYVLGLDEYLDQLVLAEEPELYAIGGDDGVYAELLWRPSPEDPLEECPVVLVSNEGEAKVVAKNFADYAERLLAARPATAEGSALRASVRRELGLPADVDALTERLGDAERELTPVFEAALGLPALFAPNMGS